MTKTFKKIVVLAFFMTCFTLILGNLYRIISTSAPDFGVLWISAKDMLVGKNPYTNPTIYTPNAYPPISEIFYLPLGFLSYQKALAVFTFISFASILGSVFLSLKLTAKKAAWHYFLLFLGLTLMSFPTKFSLGMGQINPIVLFLLLLGVYLDRKNNFLWAGVSLSIAIALKPIFVFFLLFFVLKKSWKTVLASVLLVTLLAVSTLIFWPLDIWISWFETGIVPLSNFAGREAYVNQGVVSFISRFISNINARIYLNLVTTIALIVLPVIMAIKKKGQDLVLSLFIITLLLFDTTSWQHHFVWLVFPSIVLFFRVIKSKRIILLGLLTIAYFLVSWNFKKPDLYPTILLSNQFYGTLIMWGMNIYFLVSTHKNTAKTDIGSARYKIFELFNFE